jgi:hypothetical protein
VELTLAKFLISHAVYHGGNFNGVCCQRLVQHAKEIFGEIKLVLVSKKDNCCEESAINNKMETVEDTLACWMQPLLTLIYYIQQMMKSRKHDKLFAPF